MNKMIVITIGTHTFNAEIFDTPTAQAIWDALPVDGSAVVWGEEIYFEIPVQHDLEPDAREVLEVGDLAYWDKGRAFCIFFGPTPVSQSGEPRAYSPVNRFGRITGSTAKLHDVSSGAVVRVIRALIA